MNPQPAQQEKGINDVGGLIASNVNVCSWLISLDLLCTGKLLEAETLRQRITLFLNDGDDDLKWNLPFSNEFWQNILEWSFSW